MIPERKTTPRRRFELEPEEILLSNLFGYDIYSGHSMLPISDSAKALRNKTIRLLISEARQKNKSGRVLESLDIVEFRYGLAEGAEPKTLTLEEVGKQINKTRDSARILEARGLRVLRNTKYSDRLKLFTPYDEDSLAHRLYGTTCEYDLIEAVDPDKRIDFVKATLSSLNFSPAPGDPAIVTNFLKLNINLVRHIEIAEIASAIENAFGLAIQDQT